MGQRFAAGDTRVCGAKDTDQPQAVMVVIISFAAAASSICPLMACNPWHGVGRATKIGSTMSD